MLLKKFNHSKGKYEGAISLPVYEAMSVALSNLIKSSKYDDEQLIDLYKDKSKELTAHEDFKISQERRVRPLDRMVLMSTIGQEILK